MNSPDQQLLNPYRRLRAGCYAMRFSPNTPYRGEDCNADDAERGVCDYEGTLRVVHYNNQGNLALTVDEAEAGKRGWVVYLSGDLYAMDPTEHPFIHKDIPIFPVSDYRFYLQAVGIDERGGDRFDLQLKSRELLSTGQWKEWGIVTLELAWDEAPAGSPGAFDHLTGIVRDPDGNESGRVTLSWVSSYLRRALLEIDQVNGVKAPLDNFSGTELSPLAIDARRTWASVYRKCGWRMEAVLSDQPAEPPSKVWSEPELLEALPALRDSDDVDDEWRYHLFCVGQLADGGRGYTFDSRGVAPPSTLFESVVIAARYPFTDGEAGKLEWGELAGRALEDTPAYFRTAVHEMGHAMRLRHNFTTSGFMATTDAIQQTALTRSAASPRKIDVLGTMEWDFAPDDLERLRHWPDIVVRPGGNGPEAKLPGIDEFRIMPLLGGLDESLQEPQLTLEVSPLAEEFPLGAPVRLELTLTNRGERDFQAPILRFKSGNLGGSVRSPSGDELRFVPLSHNIDDLGLQAVEPGGTTRGAITLLSGPDGPLFPSPGRYSVTVETRVYRDRQFFSLSRSAEVYVAAIVNERQERVADLLLKRKETLLAFAIGGDSLDQGNQAINLAINNRILGPHYAVVRLKRLARGIGKVQGYLCEALEILTAEGDQEPVLTTSELASLIRILLSNDGFAADRHASSSSSKVSISGAVQAELRHICVRIVFGDLSDATIDMMLGGMADALGRKASRKEPLAALSSDSRSYGIAASKALQKLLLGKIGLSVTESKTLGEALLAPRIGFFDAMRAYAKDKSEDSRELIRQAAKEAGLPAEGLTRLISRLKGVAVSYPNLLTLGDLVCAERQLLKAFEEAEIPDGYAHKVLSENLRQNLRRALLTRDMTQYDTAPSPAELKKVPTQSQRKPLKTDDSRIGRKVVVDYKPEARLQRPKKNGKP
ncbi:MAG: hypothetical protein HYR88_04540 [Verrucomicrobia bacterium]|nr:hypothetical protein [Verrucomicrobiota bacterium]MBI3866968.1 hypothetical protein [Verrucomicrobiota bacterium]